MYYIHKHKVQQNYGGPEEGGWWYESGDSVRDWKVESFTDEEEAFARCRELNGQEHDRRKNDEEYGFTSVLSYRSTHYAYDVNDCATPQEYPVNRPHYE